MEPNLEALVRGCQAGDEQAWEQLVRLQQGRVYSLALHYVGDREEARDLAQECFVRVFRQIDQLSEPRAFVGWVARIVRNAAIDRARRRKARPPAQDLAADELFDLADDSLDPAEQAERASESRMVWRALAELGAEHREIVTLKDIHGLEFEQIAQLLRVPIGTLKSRSHRARAALARQLIQISGSER
jgi:RNA polymerase sigma-70 factor, ECF subfamily